MDCETFERIVLDRVFLELDELTMGAAQRHVAHCSRCRTIEMGLRATRDVCRLPQVAPMEGFAECVIAFERQIHAVLPFRQRVNRAVSVLASYAMRPQPTMAALLLLMIGASLFLVRTRPAERDLVQVTERGVPEADTESLKGKDGRFVGSPATGAAAASLDITSNSAAAVERDPNGRRDALAHGNCDVDTADSTNGGVTGADRTKFRNGSLAHADAKQAMSELESARAIVKASGCGAAIQALETIRRKFGGSEAGQAATWEAAQCYHKMNRRSEARALFESLTESATYSRCAKAELGAIDEQ